MTQPIAIVNSHSRAEQVVDSRGRAFRRLCSDLGESGNGSRVGLGGERRQGMKENEGAGSFSLPCIGRERPSLPPSKESLLATSSPTLRRGNINLIGQIPR